MNSIYEQMNKIDDNASLMKERASKKNTKVVEELTQLRYDPEFFKYSPEIYLPTDKLGKCELVIVVHEREDDDYGETVYDVNVDLWDPNGNFIMPIDETKLAKKINNMGHPYLSSYEDMESANTVCGRVREYFNGITQEDMYKTFVNILGCDRAAVEKFWSPVEHDRTPIREKTTLSNSKSMNEAKSFTWLGVQNRIAIERDKINPFHDESAAGDYILELVGKIERDLDLSVVPSVQGGYGDVYIHLGDSHTNSGVPIGPINFTNFSNELMDLVLEADSENEFINNYRENILAYIE